MKYSEICDCCGHKITCYMHTINKGLLDGFVQLVEFYKQSHKGANLQENLQLTKNQYNNFQKLQYLGIVKRTGVGRMPTYIGLQFYDGEATIYDSVATFGKQILPPTDIRWETSKKKPKRVYIHQIDSKYYRQREEYQMEKSAQEKLF